MRVIEISEPVFSDQKLTNEFSVPVELSKYVQEKELFIKYDADIIADKSVLSIPLTAAILPLAWLTGSNLFVNSIDKKFKESMDALQNEFKAMFPSGLFKTEIIVDELVENEIKINDDEFHSGLLFSGGVDSTYTLISNLKLRPKLLMIWGIDNFSYPEHSQHWEKTISTYRKYAEKSNLELYILKTNLGQLFDNRRIEHRYHKELYNGTFRGALQHSLKLLPSAAPLSIGRFNHLLIAASLFELDRKFRPDACLPKLDEKIIWADLRVEHHGPITRLDKIESLKPHLIDDDITLRVCLKSKIVEGYLNCNFCEKCLRTILCLTFAGLDPNTCGFKVDETTWEIIRSMWEKRRTIRGRSTWNVIQRLLPEIIEQDIRGSRKFFEWFRGFDFKSADKNWFYTDLYTSLPYNLAKMLDKVYFRLGINVHDEAFIREKYRT